MKKKTLIIAFLTLGCGSLFAQTILPAILNSSTTLTAAGGPYLVQTQTILPVGGILTVQPGTDIQMSDNSNFIIKGKAEFLGTVAQPIRIHAQTPTHKWGDIFIDSSMNHCTFNYVFIEDGTFIPHHINTAVVADTNLQRATISSYYSSVEINNCTFKNNKRCIYAKYGAMSVSGCSFDSTNVEEKINIAFVRGALVENSWFSRTYGAGLHDCVDFDGVHNGIIRNNIMLYGEDDGVDLGEWESKNSDTILVSGNYIEGLHYGKGVTIGERSLHITVEKNVIVGCLQGVAVKDASNALIINNTFYKDTIGIDVYQKVAGWGGGIAESKNNIIANSILFDVRKDVLSTLTIDHSLSNTSTLAGIGNLNGDPMFESVATLNFHLLLGSPCINTGDPNSPLDPNGTIVEMGAFYFDPAVAGIINKENTEDAAFVYPNPSNGNVHIKYFSNNSSGLINIENIGGQIIYSKFFDSSSGTLDENIDLKAQAKGVYFLHIVTDKKITNKKIILN